MANLIGCDTRSFGRII